MVVVSSSEYVEQVFKTNGAIFAARPYILASDILFYDLSGVVSISYMPYWRQLRKTCIILQWITGIRFRLEKVKRKSDKILETIINEHKKDKKATFEIGKSSEEILDHEDLVDLLLKAQEGGGGCFHIADLFPSIRILQWITGIRFRLEKVKRKSDKILGTIINEHKKDKKATFEIGKSSEEILDHEDLVDVLLKAQEESDVKLTTESLKAVILMCGMMSVTGGYWQFYKDKVFSLKWHILKDPCRLVDRCCKLVLP
ncbi:hypothetical protein LWI28_000719 [Acer negundo]|uniref:Cytochrome P450 n=1 Tax=Acer negundo TaxID=4023 RepID=A0AAD5J251_ACENE|nr:hypothetical protein LWI28_000719 [Acer negundo]